MIAMASLVQACIILPVPWPAEKPRFTEEQLASVVPGTSTHESIAKTLGLPSVPQDFNRGEGRYWVYVWVQKGAGRLVMVPGDPGDNWVEEAPMSAKQFGLFLRFDGRGVLASSQLVEQSGLKICSNEHVCVTYTISDPSPMSAFTAPQQSDSWEAPSDQCRVVLWLDKADGSAWFAAAKRPSPIPFRQSPAGITITMSNGTEQTRTNWLPLDTYVVVTESPGQRFVRFGDFYSLPFHHDTLTQDVPFTCESARTYYIAVGALPIESRVALGVVWREIPADQARAQMNGMSELLLRDD